MWIDTTKGIAIDWKKETITEEYDASNPIFYGGRVQFSVDDRGNAVEKSNSSDNSSGNGIGGSMARFTIYDKTLYAVSTSDLQMFAIDNPANPQVWAKMNLGWDIETIFPWKDRLFVGSQNGVFIFNVTNPARPAQEAAFLHATGCDPVVCDDENAYVTIHGGTDCNGTINQLDVIDIRSLPAATLRKTYPMTKPKGLSLSDRYLFLCDDGLKIFDKTDPLNLKQLSHLKGIETYDVIALDATHILIVGDGGFFQYDVSDPAAPKQISQILVTP